MNRSNTNLVESSKEVLSNVNGAFQLRCPNIGRHRLKQYGGGDRKGSRVINLKWRENGGNLQRTLQSTHLITASDGATKAYHTDFAETIRKTAELTMTPCKDTLGGLGRLTISVIVIQR